MIKLRVEGVGWPRAVPRPAQISTRSTVTPRVSDDYHYVLCTVYWLYGMFVHKSTYRRNLPSIAVIIPNAVFCLGTPRLWKASVSRLFDALVEEPGLVLLIYGVCVHGIHGTFVCMYYYRVISPIQQESARVGRSPPCPTSS